MGKWEGERAIKRIENDLNRLEYNLNRTKGNKIRNLQRKKLGLTVENNSRGRESSKGDIGAFIQECRRERCRKRKKRRINKDRKKRYKPKQRRKRDTRTDSAWGETLKRADEIVRDTPQDHTPLDKTGVEWDQSKLDLMRKGQKFVPAPIRIDLVAKCNHLNDFARKLRLKVFFNNRNGVVAEEALDQELDKMPWEQMSTFLPALGENEALEKFISELSF